MSSRMQANQRLMVYDLRREHRRATGWWLAAIVLTLACGFATLARMTSSAPVTDFELGMFWVWLTLMAVGAIGWRSGSKRREACRRRLAELDALPTGPLLLAPGVSALVGAAVTAIVTTVLT